MNYAQQKLLKINPENSFQYRDVLIQNQDD